MKNKKIAPLIGIAARAQWTKTIQRKKRRLAPQKAETGKKPHGTVCVAKPFLPFSLRRRRRSPAEPSADRPASAGPPPPLLLWPTSFAGARRSPPAPSSPRPPPPPPRTASPPRDPSRAPGSSLRHGSFSSKAGEASRRGRNRVSCAPAPSSGQAASLLTWMLYIEWQLCSCCVLLVVLVRSLDLVEVIDKSGSYDCRSEKEG